MRFILLAITALSLTACASQNLQRDCKEVGGGFYLCEKYPWYKRQCERFE